MHCWPPLARRKMSPKLIHQSFPSDRRTRLTFAAPHHDVYLADFDGEWLDTELLPQASMLRYDIAAAHYDMLTEDLRRRSLSIDDAYDFSPSTRGLAFMLRVAWAPRENGGPAVDVRYGNRKAAERSRRLVLPEVTSRESVNIRAAQVEMEAWNLLHAGAT